MLVAQSCPTLCDPVDRSLPGSSVHGILQARILDWAAIRPQAYDPSSHIAIRTGAGTGTLFAVKVLGLLSKPSSFQKS